MKTIYKSDHGQQTMEKWYEHFLGKLDTHGVETEEQRVHTRYGETNVLFAGPVNATPLVCFHGAMASAPAGLAQIPDLARHFRIVFPDTIGQPGRSDHRRLNWRADEHGWWALDVLDALEMTAVNAFGISLGGYVILRLASVAPERVGKAALWAPGGLANPPFTKMFGLIWDGLMYNVRPSRPRLERVLERTFTDLDEDYVAFMGDSLEHVHPDRGFPAILPSGALAEWEAPKLLIVNENDAVFPADRLVARAEDELLNVVDTVMMEGCAHMPPFQEGALDGLIERLIAFFEEPN